MLRRSQSECENFMRMCHAFISCAHQQIYIYFHFEEVERIGMDGWIDWCDFRCVSWRNRDLKRKGMEGIDAEDFIGVHLFTTTVGWPIEAQVFQVDLECVIREIRIDQWASDILMGFGANIIHTDITLRCPERTACNSCLKIVWIEWKNLIDLKRKLG